MAAGILLGRPWEEGSTSKLSQAVGRILFPAVVTLRFPFRWQKASVRPQLLPASHWSSHMDLHLRACSHGSHPSRAWNPSDCSFRHISLLPPAGASSLLLRTWCLDGAHGDNPGQPLSFHIYKAQLPLRGPFARSHKRFTVSGFGLGVGATILPPQNLSD